MNLRPLLLIFLFFPAFSSAQNIQSMSFDELMKKVSAQGDSLVVLNFWASWCSPCVEEIPWFDKTGAEFQSQKVNMILVNLDFNSKITSVAEPFVQRKKFVSKIWHINNTDPNTWINAVDSTWSGAIPATVMFKNGKKVFFKEGQVHENELRSIIEKNSKP